AEGFRGATEAPLGVFSLALPLREALISHLEERLHDRPPEARAVLDPLHEKVRVERLLVLGPAIDQVALPHALPVDNDPLGDELPAANNFVPGDAREQLLELELGRKLHREGEALGRDIAPAHPAQLFQRDAHEGYAIYRFIRLMEKP